MNNTVTYQQKNRAWILDGVLYVVVAVLLLTLFSYGVFYLKARMQLEQIAAIDEKISMYGTLEQKQHEKQVYDYKKKIDDFSELLKSHAMPSNLFTFLEANTFEGVVFSGFTFSAQRSEIRLSGEAQDMQALGRQFTALEARKDFVSSISVFNSEMLPNGKAAFVFNLFLKPELFKYHE